MFSLQRSLLKSPLNHFISPRLGIKGQIADLNGVDIWSETFGEAQNPALLLIMGAGCQGILWPDVFCKKLETLGFFVIRFDARDMGLSSYFNYEKTPYTLLEMAKDAVALLDFLHIPKAHVLGTSMGGAVAQLMAVHFPSRVESLSLLATTSDWRNLVYALQGKSSEGLPRSSPSKEFLEWIRSLALNSAPLSWIEKLQKQFEGWRLLNGPIIPFDQKYYRNMLVKTLFRQRSYSSMLNHASAIVASLDLLLETDGKIQVPSLVIQGELDPVFPKDHGIKLSESIPGSKLLLLKDMGHNLNACFYDPIIEEIYALCKLWNVKGSG